MRIRTFMADTMAEAMSLVREELGPDAIIISTNAGKRGRGAEVRAAIEQVEQTEPVGGVFDVEDKLRAKLFAEMEHELKGLKQLRNDMRVASPTVQQPLEPNYREADIVRLLKYHRFSPLAAKPLFDAAKKSQANELGQAMGSALENTLALDPLPLAPSQPLMLVGPAGVGKTIAIAKLLARSLVNGAKPQCLTTDTVRAGALEQLGHFCSLMGETMVACDSPEKLALQTNNGPCLIDSPGVNPYRSAEMRDLKSFIQASNAEPVLVLAAGQDSEELSEVALSFAQLGVRRVIFTRLDAAQRLGSLFSAAFKAHLSIAHLGLSPYVADGFKTLTHADLGQLLADIPTVENFDTAKERAAS